MRLTDVLSLPVVLVGEEGGSVRTKSPMASHDSVYMPRTQDLMPPHILVQPSLPGFCQVASALERLAQAGIEQRGAIFTRSEVVAFMLDLVGYTAESPLHRLRLLEPSFGRGDFLLPVAQRLLIAYRRHCPDMKTDGAELHACIRAVELHAASFAPPARRCAPSCKIMGLARRVLRIWQRVG